MNKMALIYTYSKTKVGHIQIDPFLNYLHKLLKSCQVRQSAFEISTFQMFIFLRNYLESEMTTKFLGLDSNMKANITRVRVMFILNPQ